MTTPTRASIPSVARIERLRRRKPIARLTGPIKEALADLGDAGEAIHFGAIWKTQRGAELRFQTIEAMFARGLVMIVYPDRATRRPHRKVSDLTRARHVVRLTETGALLAQAIKLQMADNFEDSPHVYANDAERETVS